MCAIAGIYGENAPENLRKMLISLKHRGPDSSGIWIDENLIKGDICNFNFPRSCEGKSRGMGHNLLSIVGGQGSQPIMNQNMVLVCNGEIYNYQEIKNKIGAPFKTDSDCEVIIGLLNYFYKDDFLNALQKTIKCLDGDYAFTLWNGQEMVLARDPVGVKPLYYGEIPGEINAFASERKALWDLGIREVHALPAGHILYKDKLIKIDGPFKNEVRKHTINADNIKPDISFKEDLAIVLKNAVEKRIRGLEKVALIFSGGVDSTLLASILKDISQNDHPLQITLYTVGTENSPDIEFAIKAAECLDLDLRTLIVDENVIRNNLEPVIRAIEEFNIMKIGVGMPTYLAAQMVHEDGIRVALSGQGADELFGGYHRYLKSYKEKEGIQKVLKEDIENIYHVNLQRDDAVTMAHGVELRVPFLDKEVIDVAFNIPVKYKIESADDPLRKHILRDVALDLGVPEFIAQRPKKAAQYGSGIHKILMKKVLKEFDDEAFMKDLRGF